MTRGVFPQQLIQELEKYYPLAKKADEPMLLAKAELKEIEEKLEKAIRERDEIKKEIAKRDSEIARQQKRIKDLDYIIESLHRVKAAMNKKAE